MNSVRRNTNIRPVHRRDVDAAIVPRVIVGDPGGLGATCRPAPDRSNRVIQPVVGRPEAIVVLAGKEPLTP